jgi:hypothetical protein
MLKLNSGVIADPGACLELVKGRRESGQIVVAPLGCDIAINCLVRSAVKSLPKQEV